MKTIVCELCGGKEVVKQDGFFICQECGAKYTPEDARKLMVEIEGEAGLSKKMKNLYERARKSLEVDDLTHAAEYYKQILDENPNDWEAYFYSYLGEFTSYTNAQAGSVADKLGNTIPPAYDMALDCENIEEAANRVKTITQKTSEKLAGIAATGVSLLKQYEGGSILSPAGKVNSDLYDKIRPTAVNTVVSAVLAMGEIDNKLTALAAQRTDISSEVWNECLKTIRRTRFNTANITYSPTSATTEKLIKDEKIQEYAQKLKEVDPTFTVPAPSTTDSSGGCYVATAVYGSYDCPQVWTLRRYRDNTLAKTRRGRSFIRTYYAISPTLVKWFGDTVWFRNLWKPKLDKMVRELNEKGIEDTPYEDKQW